MTTSGLISTYPDTKLSWMMGIQVCPLKGHSPFKGDLTGSSHLISWLFLTELENLFISVLLDMQLMVHPPPPTPNLEGGVVLFTDDWL